MTKTMTVGDLISELSQIPLNVPIFVYDYNKERDMCIQKVDLAGPVRDPDDDDIFIKFDSSPYYTKGASNIEAYWHEHGACPIICLRELHPKELQVERKENV